jgi:hypothetical protein
VLDRSDTTPASRANYFNNMRATRVPRWVQNNLPLALLLGGVMGLWTIVRSLRANREEMTLEPNGKTSEIFKRV